MTPRRCAFDALQDVLTQGAYANLRLKSLPPSLSDRDAKFIHALLYTTLEHLLTIDFYISNYAKGRVKPAVRGVLRLGICELVYLCAPDYAVCSEYVNLAREIGKGALSGFVNGVLRAVAKDAAAGVSPALPEDRVTALSIQYSYPEWIVSLWSSAYGDSFTEALLQAAPAKIEVRAQYPHTTDALQSALPVPSEHGMLDENALVLSSGMDFLHLSLFTEGKMAVMGQGAMLACRALGDVRGKRVLDACAAPGGKSAYIASLCENDVSLTCFELHAHRKALLERTFERLHVSATLYEADASVFDAAYVDSFDAVLVDAPCSGLGLVADKPDLRYTKTPDDVVALAQTQSAILNTVCRYLKPGGTLVYATCTISPEENERRVAAFLAEHTNFALSKIPISIENDGTLQLFAHIHHTDGFYIARLCRCI